MVLSPVSKQSDVSSDSFLKAWLADVCLVAIEECLFEHVNDLLGVENTSLDEYSLIQHLEAQGFFDALEGAPATLGLFAKHFVVRRSFYRLRGRFCFLGWGIRFELMHLRFYSVEPAASKQIILASDALIAGFYDDVETLSQATADGVNKLLADFWVRFEAYQRADSAYGVLGVPVDATWAEIQQAYRSLAAKYHPDKGGDTDAFVAVKAAYDRLKALNASYK